ncbi:MAG: PH domain-containing protein [Dyadobacter sp.]|uniref:PH domain-containing protein n=1 Tax=Dyadobacter sp. TaxID=1914288 RepID=UPI0032663BEC
MTYKASWDNATKIITVAITVFFIAIIIATFMDDGGNSVAGRYFIAVMIVAIYAVCYALRPVHYIVTKDKLIIHRPVSDVSLSREQMESVELLDDKMLKWTFRTFGVGGLFGYFGKFANSKLGSMTWYATRRRKTVLIKTSQGKSIIVTPDDADDFVNQFEVHHTAIP